MLGNAVAPVALAFGVALMAFEAVPLLLLGLAPVWLLLALTMFVSGIAVEQFVIAWNVSLQQNVPADRLSRVYSYDAMVSLAAMPLGQMAVGPLAVAFGVRSTLVGRAVLALVPTGLALLSRSLRSLGRTA